MPCGQEHREGELPGVDHGFVEDYHRTRDADPEHDVHPSVSFSGHFNKLMCVVYY